jgi:hypothetical protein
VCHFAQNRPNYVTLYLVPPPKAQSHRFDFISGIEGDQIFFWDIFKHIKNVTVRFSTHSNGLADSGADVKCISSQTPLDLNLRNVLEISSTILHPIELCLLLARNPFSAMTLHGNESPSTYWHAQMYHRTFADSQSEVVQKLSQRHCSGVPRKLCSLMKTHRLLYKGTEQARSGKNVFAKLTTQACK